MLFMLPSLCFICFTTGNFHNLSWCIFSLFSMLHMNHSTHSTHLNLHQIFIFILSFFSVFASLFSFNLLYFLKIFYFCIEKNFLCIISLFWWYKMLQTKSLYVHLYFFFLVYFSIFMVFYILFFDRKLLF